MGLSEEKTIRPATLNVWHFTMRNSKTYKNFTSASNLSSTREKRISSAFCCGSPPREQQTKDNILRGELVALRPIIALDNKTAFFLFFQLFFFFFFFIWVLFNHRKCIFHNMWAFFGIHLNFFLYPVIEIKIIDA